MPKINLLSKHVAELIAAGEVVERPLNVAKEILENSIDAGARNITLEIRRGGTTYIRITDDGCGITREDVPLAFVSHATSKITDAESLNSIASLGFRGEALASIAAVSKVEILTRTEEESIGTRYVVEGGEHILTDDAGCPVGTTLIIRDLFFNTPARMKFLKKDITEANAIAGIMDRIALSHPEISFKFVRDGNRVMSTPGDGKLASAIYSVIGKSFFDELIEVKPYTIDGITVSGYVTKPTASKASRNLQYFFVNNRTVKSLTGMKALEEAYKNSIMVGKFPACVLNLECVPEFVDVNIHPTKTEVRFANDKNVFNVIYYAVKNALAGDQDVRVAPVKAKVENFKFDSRKPEQIRFKPNENFWQTMSVIEKNDKPKVEPVKETFIKTPIVNTSEKAAKSCIDIFVEETKSPSNVAIPVSEYRIDSGSQIELPKAETEENNTQQTEVEIYNAPIEAAEENEKKESAEQEVTVPDFRVIGEAFLTYIIVESEGKLFFIDKHAAHERMIFNQLKNQQTDSSVQMLLTPVYVTLSKENYSAIIENLEILSENGFEAEDFGAGTVKVTECPMNLDTEDVKDVLQEFSDSLLSGKTKFDSGLSEKLLESIACKAAIKAGHNTTQYEMNKFVEKLMSMPEIRYCPHGRPVMIEMTKYEIEKIFGRLG